MPRLTRLDVEHFRGVSQRAALVFNSKSLLLFGENGSGKTSFVDALEKLLTRKVSTLDGRASGLSSEKHGPHIHAKHGSDTSISLTFDDPRRTIVDLTSAVGPLPPTIRGYLDAATQNLYILRRRQLLELIESPPRERYDFVRPFLPLDKVEELEAALRQAKDETARAAFLATQRLDSRLGDLGRAIGGQIALPGAQDQIHATLAARLSPLGVSVPPSLSNLEEVTQRLVALLAPFGDLTRQSRLAAIVDAVSDTQTALAGIDLTRLQTTISDLRAREAREARIVYEGVLEQGARWITEASLVHCPLCEQSIEAGPLVERIRQRLEGVREIVSLRRTATDQRDQIRERVFAALQALPRIRNRVAEASLAYPESSLLFISRLGQALQDLHDALTQDIRLLSEEMLNLFVEELRDVSSLEEFSALRRHVVEQTAAIPSSDQAREVLAVKALVDRLVDLWPSFVIEQREATRRHRETEIAQRLVDAAEVARKQAVQAFFDELSEDINAIFQKLHPDESHGGVRLEIREAVQKSVSLRADFFDRRSEDPRAYYSEAHLDTLGLSIFLALRKWYRRQRPAFDLLVLDDVMTSVDTAHSVRLSEVLLTDFKDYQMFITTHDRIWFEHLWDIQTRCGMAQNFVNKVIHKWTLDEGPDLREPEEERRALDRLLQDGSSQEIASMAGRLLEHTLQEMRYSLRLSIQAKRGEVYEIGDMWPAFYSVVKREYPVLYEKARGEMEALDVRWPLRNWVGAHWNTWARNVPRTSAIEFARAVRGLFDLVFCPDCRRFVSPSGTPLGQLSCRCGHKIYSAPGKAPKLPVNREELVRSTQGALSNARLDTVRLMELRRAERAKEN